MHTGIVNGFKKKLKNSIWKIIYFFSLSNKSENLKKILITFKGAWHTHIKFDWLKSGSNIIE